MRFWLALAPVCLLAQAIAPDALVGDWVNERPDGAAFTRLLVRRDGDHLLVRGWRRCLPLDCDLGEAVLTLDEKGALAGWQRGLRTDWVELSKVSGSRLQVVEIAEEQGRVPERAARRTAQFVRAPEPDGRSAPALALLGKVAAKYRDLSMARFETEEEETEPEYSCHNTTRIFFGRRGQMRAEIASCGLDPTVLIRTGTQAWQERPAQRAPAIAEYGLIDRYPAIAEIAGAARVEDADCTIVALSGPGRTRRLWIDPATLLVRKDEAEARRPEGGVARLRITYTIAATGQKMEPELFEIEAGAGAPVTPSPALALIGKPAPALALRDERGAPVELAQFRGKVVLLGFSATRCQRCPDLLKFMQRAYDPSGKRGLVLLGIYADELGALELFREAGCTFRALLDPDGQTAGRYNIVEFPAAVVINGDGRIVFWQSGEVFEKELRETLERQGAW